MYSFRFSEFNFAMGSYNVISFFGKNIFISFTSGETQKIMFIIIFDSLLKDEERSDEIEVHILGVDEIGKDEVGIINLRWLLITLRIVCYP